MESMLRDITSSCRIRIDKEGKWYYEGNEIINALVLRNFCDSLEMDADGRYRIVMAPEICYVEVEDTPFVVSAIRGDPCTGLFLRLNTMKTYPLEPGKLCIGEENVLYAILPNGMKVRFTRQAYYTLALLMEQDETGTIVLKVKDTTYPICPGE